MLALLLHDHLICAYKKAWERVTNYDLVIHKEKALQQTVQSVTYIQTTLTQSEDNIPRERTGPELGPA